MHIFDCGRGYGETKSPSSCKAEKIPEGFWSDIAKLALKMIALYISQFTQKKEKSSSNIECFLNKYCGISYDVTYIIERYNGIEKIVMKIYNEKVHYRNGVQ